MNAGPEGAGGHGTGALRVYVLSRFEQRIFLRRVLLFHGGRKPLVLRPISQKKILVYGLVRQLQTSLLLGFFLVFQYGWLYNTYGISIGAMLTILLGYGAVTFCSQLDGHDHLFLHERRRRRKRLIKYTMRGVYLVLIAAVALPLLENTQDLLGGAVASATAPWVSFIPVSAG